MEGSCWAIYTRVELHDQTVAIDALPASPTTEMIFTSGQEGVIMAWRIPHDEAWGAAVPVTHVPSMPYGDRRCGMIPQAPGENGGRHHNHRGIR